MPRAADRVVPCVRTPTSRPTRRGRRSRQDGEPGGQNASRRALLAWRTIAKQRNKAKSGFLFFELAQPFFGLPAHIFGRGTTKARPALYRTADRENGEYVVVDSRFHLTHNREGQPVQGDARAGRLGDDPARDVVRFAKWNLQRPHKPVGEIGCGGVAL